MLGKYTCTHAYIHRVIKALRATQRFGSQKIAHLSNRSHHPTSQPEPLDGDGFRDRLVSRFKHRLKHGCFHQPFGDYYRGMDCSRVCTHQVLGKLTVFLIAIGVLPPYYVRVPPWNPHQIVVAPIWTESSPWHPSCPSRSPDH